MDKLEKYFSKYMTPSSDLLARFRKVHAIKEYKKGSLILIQGEISNETFFILEGCIRSYIIDNCEEKTIEFYIEEDPVIPLNYGQNLESVHYLECIEDTIVVVSNEEIEEKMLNEFPELKEASRIYSKRLIENIQNKFAEYRISTPEERYKYFLLNKPQMVNRIPQYLLASYLGVKPESLSRIKRRLSEN